MDRPADSSRRRAVRLLPPPHLRAVPLPAVRQPDAPRATTESHVLSRGLRNAPAGRVSRNESVRQRARSTRPSTGQRPSAVASSAMSRATSLLDRAARSANRRQCAQPIRERVRPRRLRGRLSALSAAAMAAIPQRSARSAQASDRRLLSGRRRHGSRRVPASRATRVSRAARAVHRLPPAPTAARLVMKCLPSAGSPPATPIRPRARRWVASARDAGRIAALGPARRRPGCRAFPCRAPPHPTAKDRDSRA